MEAIIAKGNAMLGSGTVNTHSRCWEGSKFEQREGAANSQCLEREVWWLYVLVNCCENREAHEKFFLLFKFFVQKYSNKLMDGS